MKMKVNVLKGQFAVKFIPITVLCNQIMPSGLFCFSYLDWSIFSRKGTWLG